MDRTLIATQAARLYASTGVLLTYGTIVFPANFEPYVPPVTDSDRNIGNDTVIVVKTARSVFGATLPREGQHFTDAGAVNYRVQSLPSMPPSDPVVKFVCKVSALS